MTDNTEPRFEPGKSYRTRGFDPQRVAGGAYQMPEKTEPLADVHGDARVRTKLTIKGGWVNYYPNSHPVWHATREDADSSATTARFACIQVPDITEGEGL